MRVSILFLYLCLSNLSYASEISLPTTFQLKSLSNKNSEISENFKDRTTLMVFWASWCSTCKLVIKDAEKIARDNKNITLRFISVDDSVLAAKSYLKRNRMGTFTRSNAFFDQGTKLASSLDVSSIPGTYLISPERAVLHFAFGKIEKKDFQRFLIKP